MGQFESGKWIVALSLYFFVLFVCVFCIVNAASEEGIDMGGVYFNDPGFQSSTNDPSGVGSCQGTIQSYCFRTLAESNDSCSSIPGCTWSGTLCIGQHNLSCADQTDREFCQLLRCTYFDATGVEQPDLYVSPSEAYNVGSVTRTIGVVTGIGYGNASLGIPAGWAFVGQFLIFWLPFFMLLWAVYMALPFLH